MSSSLLLILRLANGKSKNARTRTDVYATPNDFLTCLCGLSLQKILVDGAVDRPPSLTFGSFRQTSEQHAQTKKRARWAQGNRFLKT